MLSVSPSTLWASFLCLGYFLLLVYTPVWASSFSHKLSYSLYSGTRKAPVPRGRIFANCSCAPRIGLRLTALLSIKTLCESTRSHHDASSPLDPISLLCVSTRTPSFLQTLRASPFSRSLHSEAWEAPLILCYVWPPPSPVCNLSYLWPFLSIPLSLPAFSPSSPDNRVISEIITFLLMTFVLTFRTHIQ